MKKLEEKIKSYHAKARLQYETMKNEIITMGEKIHLS